MISDDLSSIARCHSQYTCRFSFPSNRIDRLLRAGTLDDTSWLRPSGQQGNPCVEVTNEIAIERLAAS
jgi:hypothetical protein